MRKRTNKGKKELKSRTEKIVKETSLKSKEKKVRAKTKKRDKRTAQKNQKKKVLRAEKIVIKLSGDHSVPIDTKKYKEKLIRLKEEILQKILRERREERERLREESVPEPGDESDFAQKEREMEMASIFSYKDKNKLDLIENALKKIEEGTYGICESCGISIEEMRLDIIPFARYCVQCQGIKDREEDIYRETEFSKMVKGTGVLDIPDEES